MNDITIIIQGPIGKKFSDGLSKGIRNLETYCKFGDIIISTWKNNPVKPSKKFLSKHNITMIESDPDIYKNMYSNANMNYHVASTLNGLKKVTTKSSRDRVKASSPPARKEGFKCGIIT